MAKSKRAKRDVRFEILKNFHTAVAAGLMSEESAKQNVELTGHIIFQSELDKFFEQNPDYDKESFTQFLNNVGAIKDAGKRASGASRYSLNTAEKAKEIGVAEENIPQYINLVEQMFGLRDELKKIVETGTVTITIPVREKKESAQAGT